MLGCFDDVWMAAAQMETVAKRIVLFLNAGAVNELHYMPHNI
jgi:hypothetical protein